MFKSVDFPHEEFSFDVMLESISEPRKGDRRVFTNSTLEQIVVKLFNVLGHGLSLLSEALPFIKKSLVVGRGKVLGAELDFHVFPSVNGFLTSNSPQVFNIEPISLG